MHRSITPNDIKRDDIFTDWFEKRFGPAPEAGPEAEQYERLVKREQLRFHTHKHIQNFLNEQPKKINKKGREALVRLHTEPDAEVDASLAVVKESLKDPATSDITLDCLWRYFPVDKSGKFADLSKDVIVYSILKTHTTSSTISAFSETGRFFREKTQPLRDLLKAENSARAAFEEIIRIHPHKTMREESPEDAQAVIKKAIEQAEQHLNKHPRCNFLFKQGPLAQHGMPPMYLAAVRANEAMWRFLREYLEQKLDADIQQYAKKKDAKGQERAEAFKEDTLAIAELQWSVTNVDLDKVRNLISINPDLLTTQNPLTRWDCTPLFIAARQHNRDTHDILMKHVPEGIPESVIAASECLYFVSGGQQAQAKELVEKNPDLLTQAGIDGHSPLQMAASLGDMHMLRMLLSCLKDEDKPTAILQLEEVDKNCWRFNPKPFLAAYQTYVNNYDEWYEAEAENGSALRTAWQKIGWELRLAPQHVVAEFCQDHPLYPTPNVKKQTLKRQCEVYNYNEDLFPLISDSGLGFDCHLMRGPAGEAWPWRWVDLRCGWRRRASDFLAMKTLFTVRRDEYEEIKQVLKDPERELQGYLQPSSGCCIC